MGTGLGTTPSTSSVEVRLHGIIGLVVGVAALIVLTVLIAPGTAVAAGKNPDAKYYLSRVTSIEPATPGLEVVVHGRGESVTLTNRTGRPVVVLGYSGEQYLRINADGVQVNANSPTAALNAERSGRPAEPVGKGKSARWLPVGEGPSFTWQDYRPQWSAEARPPIVTADPHARHQVFAWGIQLTVDSRPALVRGTVDWTGTPWISRTVLTVAGVVLLLALGSALLLGLRRRRVRPIPPAVPPPALSPERATQSSGAR